MGTSAPQTRTTGASSQSKACSIITAAISEPMPATGQPSSRLMMRLVFLTEPTMVAMSSGRMVRRLMTSASIPSAFSSSAASSAT